MELFQVLVFCLHSNAEWRDDLEASRRPLEFVEAPGGVEELLRAHLVNGPMKYQTHISSGWRPSRVSTVGEGEKKISKSCRAGRMKEVFCFFCQMNTMKLILFQISMHFLSTFQGPSLKNDRWRSYLQAADPYNEKCEHAVTLLVLESTRI